MIPTVLLPGLLAGVLLGHRAPGRLLLVGGVVAVLFGLAVGISDDSLSTFAGGTALSAVNVAVGALVGTALRAALSGLLPGDGRPRPSSSR